MVQKIKIESSLDLKLIRNGLNLSQAEMGQLMGVTSSTISRWERSESLDLPSWHLSVYQAFSQALATRDDLRYLVRHWLVRYGNLATLNRLLTIVYEKQVTLI